ncbi:MAG TPA: hypothetical protein VFW90_01225 [Candidatus Saccharimonadales bacterium]|nr:hypothetical protein [Candidatus Saccharimonadales bacterium]
MDEILHTKDPEQIDNNARRSFIGRLIAGLRKKLQADPNRIDPLGPLPTKPDEYWSVHHAMDKMHDREPTPPFTRPGAEGQFPAPVAEKTENKPSVRDKVIW